ncbi:MAG: hypothetical protein PHP53_12370 [Prolixibacteraceae bacterium]|nr:hypothetical protein [Prolixibacteraceae bacterium]
MKILYFVLGALESRIKNSGSIGLNSLLRQDIIFYGPIPEDRFVFEEKEIPIIKIWNETSINELFNALPEKWYPDIVTCETSVLNIIPDIYKCPVKTYLMARDAWIDTIYNKGIVELFDFIRYDGIDRDSYISFNPNLMPLSGCPTFLEDSKIEKRVRKFKDRPIDVIAIANYISLSYHTRYELFFELAKNMPQNFKIKFLIAVKRNEINNYYRQSKIIIDWSYTLANRSYEAAINGCLLFSHEDNKVIEQVWKPWEEYIPFNNSNLIELVEYYVLHDDESEKIITNALKKLNTNPISWGDSILSHLHQALESTHLPSDRIKYLDSIDQTTLLHRLATPLYFNYHFSQYSIPNNWKEVYFQRIDKSIAAYKNEEEQTLLPPLVEASRMAFILNRYELALEYIIKLKSIFPNYAWTYYLHGRILFDQKEYRLSEENFKKAISYGKVYPELLTKYILPFAESENVCDHRRVTDYLWQSSYNHNNEYQEKALNNLCYTALGDLFLINNDAKKATEQFILANTNLPIPSSLNKVCELYLKANQYNELLEASTMGLDDSPYDYKLFIFKTIALIKLNRKKEARSILKEEAKILKCFERNKIAEKLSLIFRLLAISLYFEKQLSIMGFSLLLKKL